MGQHLLGWTCLLVGLGGIVLFWLAGDGVRANGFAIGLGELMDRLGAGRLGRWFDRGAGIPMARLSLREHVQAGRMDRALAIARQYGLATEAAELLIAKDGFEIAARFARDAGDEVLARRLFTEAFAEAKGRGEHVRTAEMAEAAGDLAGAVAAWEALPDHGGARQAAALVQRMGKPFEALRRFMDADDGPRAMRLASHHGLERELIAYALAQGPVAPHGALRLAGEVAVQRGDLAAAVRCFRLVNDLPAALLAARKGELAQEEREILAIQRGRREAEGPAGPR